MKECRLPAYTELVDSRAGIHIGPALKEQRDRCEVVVFSRRAFRPEV